jgi:hypothetical protein
MHGACGVIDNGCTIKLANNSESVNHMQNNNAMQKKIKTACSVNDYMFFLLFEIVIDPHAFFLSKTRSYLDKFEAEFKKANGPRVYCLMKKTEGRKSHDTVPLTVLKLILS